MNYKFSKKVGAPGIGCMKFALRNWMAVVAVLALVFSITFGGEEAISGAGASMACLPFLSSKPKIFCEEFKGDNGGGGDGAVLTPKEFQTKTLSAIEKVGKQNDAKLDAFQDANKKSFEELTELKNNFEGTQGDIEQINNKISQIALKASMAQRKASGDPIRDILADPEKKNLINAQVRKALNKPLNEAHTKALTSASGVGATLIDDELHTDIYDVLSSFGIWASFDVRSVNRKTNKFLVKTARPVALFFGEGITITEDTAKAGVSVTATASGIKVLLTVPSELLDDSEVDLSQDILADFIEAVAYRLDWMCLQADGTADSVDGGFTGIFSGGTSAVAASGNTTVETLDLEDVTAAMLATDEAVMQRNACWWIHPHMLVRMLHIKDANGRPIFLTATEAPSPGALGTLLGYPVKISPAAPNDNSAGKPIAAFGDPMALAVGLRKGFEFKSSTEANFSDDEVVFRGIARAACVLRRATAIGVLETAAS